MSNGETAGADERPEREPGPEVEPDLEAGPHAEPEPERESEAELGLVAATEPEGETPPERDWDAEWRSLTTDLAPPRPRYLVSDTPRVGPVQGPRDYVAAEDPDEDLYVPELPTRTPVSRATALAWAAIAAGPTLMLLAVIAFDRAPTWYVATCLGLFLTGLVIVFTRLPGSRREGGDDGSAV